MDIESRITRLVRRIDKGTITKREAQRIIEYYEQVFGPFDLLYDVNDRNDKEYYEELKSDALIGIYNKASLLKMAEIRCPATAPRSSLTGFLIIAISLIALIIAVVIAITGGKT